MKGWNQDTALARFRKLPSTYGDLSEADTRAKIIDVILREVLGWQEENIKREERCLETGTFIDYKLITNVPHIIIEAKKNGFDFELPKGSSHREYKIGGVLQTSRDLVAAMVQARDYAVSKGIVFCVVTNGSDFVFFRAQNQLGIDWTEHVAVLFRGLSDIESNFDLFCQLLSKDSIERGALPRALPVSRDTEQDAARFRNLDPSHLAKPRTKDRNKLFPYLGDIVYRVFQDLAREDSDSEILEHCYVETPRKTGPQPYLDRAALPLSVNKKDAGEFQTRVVSALTAGKKERAEVILLLGSVGVGKSTFIQRFRKVLAKGDIDKNGIWVYFNFKKFSDTGESLNGFIDGQIEDSLSKDYKDLPLFE